MKKISLLILSALFATVSFSQDFNKVYRCSYIKYVNERWVDESTNYPEGMYIFLDGNEIKITNDKQSKFVTYGNPVQKKYEGYVCNTWDAYDKEGRDCQFIMKYFYEKKIYVFMFMYYKYNTGFEYEIVAEK